MAIEYVPAQDILDIEFPTDVTIADSVHHDGVIIDYAEDGGIVAIEILDASRRVSKDPLHRIDLAIVAEKPAGR